MDNHQAELAHQLEKMGHVIVATPSTLLETLHNFDESDLRPYNAPDGKSIAQYINKLCGL
jgi:UDP-N-acetylglucosamine transferase subunit ALG13